MTADPVGVPVRPGRRAVEFARWAAEEFGTAGPRPGTVIVDRAQKALTAAYGRGAGTVAWYMAQLRSAGVVLASRPLMLDLSALDEPSAEPARLSSADDGRPELVALLARHAELVGQAAQLLADMTAIQAEMARVVANDEPAKVAELAIVRDIQEVRKVDLNHLPDLPAREPKSRNPRNSRPLQMTLADVDRLVEPLRELCRSTGRPDHLDDRGRHILAQLTPDALEAGVANVVREATDLRVTRPVGLLIDRARRRDSSTFTVAHAGTPSTRSDPSPSCSGCHGTGHRLILDPTSGEEILGTDVPCPCTIAGSAATPRRGPGVSGDL